MIKQIEVYADGACSPNPGIGGYGVVAYLYMTDGEIYEVLLSGYKKQSTNNEMELTSIVESIKLVNMLKQEFGFNNPCLITFVSDSSYCMNAINLRWLYKWEQQGYMNNGALRPNTILWKELRELLKVMDYSCNFKLVKGHSSTKGNCKADKLAVNARLTGNTQTVINKVKEGL